MKGLWTLKQIYAINRRPTRMLDSHQDEGISCTWYGGCVNLARIFEDHLRRHIMHIQFLLINKASLVCSRALRVNCKFCSHCSFNCYTRVRCSQVNGLPSSLHWMHCRFSMLRHSTFHPKDQPTVLIGPSRA